MVEVGQLKLFSASLTLPVAIVSRPSSFQAWAVGTDIFFLVETDASIGHPVRCAAQFF